MEDNFRHKGMRKKLAESLQKEGISDLNVLKAIEMIPRHLFLDKAFVEIAYENKPFPIGKGQTISHPFTVAYQTQLLEIKKGEKVPVVPQKLLEQLAIGGIMVVPLNEGVKQKMLRITRINQNEYKREGYDDFVFVPMLQGTEV